MESTTGKALKGASANSLTALDPIEPRPVHPAQGWVSPRRMERLLVRCRVGTSTLCPPIQ